MTDAELLSAFERHELSEFRHREHIRVGFALLQRERDIGRAVAAFRAVAGHAAKYRDDVTRTYMMRIAERMHAYSYATSEELLAAHPEL